MVNASIHSSKSRRHEREAPGGSRRPLQVLELPRSWPRPCPSYYGWPCVVKPWWISEANAFIPSRQLYTLHWMVIVRHGYPWVPTNQAHGHPQQVGPAYQKTRRPVSRPARPEMWVRRREDSLACKTRKSKRIKAAQISLP
jgi:hypothetical protein